MHAAAKTVRVIFSDDDNETDADDDDNNSSFFSSFLQTAVLTLCIFKGDNFPVLLLATLGIGIPNGATWCLTPVMTSELFGTRYFGRNWGSMMLGVAFVGLGLQKTFGVLYDLEITTKGQTDCFGLHCFRWSFVILAVLSFCSCVFYVGLLERMLQRRREKRKEREMGTRRGVQNASGELSEPAGLF